MGHWEQALPELLSWVKTDSCFLTRSYQDTRCASWGVRNEEPIMPRVGTANSHSHISKARREVVYVAFASSHPAQNRILLDQVMGCEDFQYFGVNLAKGFLRPVYDCQFGFCSDQRQLLGIEEEGT